MMRATHSPPSSDALKPMSAALCADFCSEKPDCDFVWMRSSPSELVDQRRGYLSCSVFKMTGRPSRRLRLSSKPVWSRARCLVGHAVFQTVHAAGILPNIASDGAGAALLTKGRAHNRSRRSSTAWDTARLVTPGSTAWNAIVEIDSAHAIELATPRRTPSPAHAPPAPAPARYDLDALAVAVGEHRGDLFGGLVQYDHHRKRPIGGETVAFVARRIASSEIITPSPCTYWLSAATISTLRVITALSGRGIVTGIETPPGVLERFSNVYSGVKTVLWRLSRDAHTIPWR